tara:strand:+ start:967 stop:1386 length:420 start_codon:yes stop_codon:yes gene_type:complete
MSKCVTLGNADQYDCDKYNTGLGRLQTMGMVEGCKADGACRWSEPLPPGRCVSLGNADKYDCDNYNKGVGRLGDNGCNADGACQWIDPDDDDGGDGDGDGDSFTPMFIIIGSLAIAILIIMSKRMGRQLPDNSVGDTYD